MYPAVRSLLLAALLAVPTFAQGAWWNALAPADPVGQASMTPDIRFFGPTQGWALTSMGRLLRTRDGGTTWSRIGHPDPDSVINSMSFISADSGWIATLGGALYQTTDAGANWTQRIARGGGYDHVAYFVSADSGWRFISSWTARIWNSGANWRSGQTADLSTGSFRKAHFTPGGIAWCLRRSAVVKKDTGVYAWAVVPGVTDAANLNALFFVDSNRGWVAGKAGVIRRTTDQGLTWTSLTSGTTKALHALTFTHRDSGWALGDSGVALRTVNGGQSWHAFPVPTLETLVAAYFIDSRNGWALGAQGGIYRTFAGNVSLAGAIQAREAGPILFSSAGRIHYRLSAPARVRASVRAVDGARVATLFDGPQAAGEHTLELAGRGLTPGIHMLTLDRDGSRASRAIFIP